MPRRILFLLSVCVALGGAGRADASEPDLPRVRGVQPRAVTLLAMGQERSFVFRQLVEQLGRTDVIVYVDVTTNLPRRLAGRTTLMHAAGHVRYVRVEIRADIVSDELVPILGHELQHALEIAVHPEARDNASMRGLYAQIGRAAPHLDDAYDTVAARDVELRIRREVRTAAPAALIARSLCGVRGAEC